MVMVIGVSTSVEYVIRAAYETLVGRLSELASPRGLTEEDRYGARVAQDYVDFIRDSPWYEYDFAARLARAVARDLAVRARTSCASGSANTRSPPSTC